jgi:hypothetical protein
MEGDVSTTNQRTRECSNSITIGLTQYIGPIKSLFWIYGYDELVRAIDDPAYVIEDEIRVIPAGTGVGFLLDQYFEEGKIPRHIYFRTLGYVYPPSQPIPVMITQVNTIPRAITANFASHNIGEIHPLSRPQCLPDTVNCLRVKWERKIDRLITNVRNLTGDLLDKNDLWFRGLTRDALTHTLAFFVPVITGKSMDNEFGPGLYTANDFKYALDYCSPVGAIMVFKNPDLRKLNIWEPTVTDWNQLVATWLQLPLSGVSDIMPEKYKDADIIRGPISAPREEANDKKRFPERSENDQLVAVSYKGCEALSRSLHLIIYMEP